MTLNMDRFFRFDSCTPENDVFVAVEKFFLKKCQTLTCEKSSNSNRIPTPPKHHKFDSDSETNQART